LDARRAASVHASKNYFGDLTEALSLEIALMNTAIHRRIIAPAGYTIDPGWGPHALKTVRQGIANP
jgi:hypothetical protein